jgi:hypothetical protein
MKTLRSAGRHQRHRLPDADSRGEFRKPLFRGIIKISHDRRVDGTQVKSKVARLSTINLVIYFFYFFPVLRAQTGPPPDTAAEMQGFAQVLADSIRSRIQSGQNITTRRRAPLMPGILDAAAPGLIPRTYRW